LLVEWFGRPHVAVWWREAADLDAVETAYGPMVDGSDPTEGFIALRQGAQPIAFIQRYRLDDNRQWQESVAVGVGHLTGAGIDYLIGDDAQTGQGLGRQMIADFVDLTWTRYPDISDVVVAVQQENVASWKALEGAGFGRVWAGTLASEDPSDQGPSYLYRLARPAG
jgi:aminoglycoside 6'-N-acetyltransferase